MTYVSEIVSFVTEPFGCRFTTAPVLLCYLTLHNVASNGDFGLSEFFNAVCHLISTGTVRISEHGYDELAENGLTVKELLYGIDEAQIVAEYPDYPKGRCILLLQKDNHGNPAHVLWGIPKGYEEPAVLVTAYKPNPKRWDHTYLHRVD